MKYLVIGAGRMAIGIVHDLLSQASTEKVIVTDISSKALQLFSQHFHDSRVEIQLAAANDRETLQKLMEKSNGVLSAVPYDFNFNLCQWAIAAGCHFVDLGGNNTMVEKQFTLDAEAKSAGVGIVPDCGLAPGMMSVVAAHAVAQLDETETMEIRVGGLPLSPRTPLNYMLVFSMHGLINEYIEEAVIIKNGRQKHVPSMTEIEELTFPKPFGKLEAFYTSGGTSTLPQTFLGKIKNLNYKTIRYPGHCYLMKAMIDLGFTSENKVNLRDQSLTMREVFEPLLSVPLSYEGEDVVLMRLSAEGMKNGKPKKMQWQAIEYGDKTKGLTAMMRTTAFPAAIVLEMLCDGRISHRGVLRQEQAIPTDLFMQELEKRNIRFSII